MKNQMRPVCSPKDKIWWQRCRRQPLEQDKLRQILKNKSEDLLIRRWFDRWYVTEALCDRLTISFRINMNPGAGDPYGKFAQYLQYPPGWIYSYMLNDRGNVNHSPSASVANAESLPESPPQFIENSSTPGAHSMVSWGLLVSRKLPR